MGLENKEPKTIGVNITPVINGSILNAICNINGKINGTALLPKRAKKLPKTPIK